MNVTDLRMHEAVQGRAVNHDAAANSRADREIDQVCNVARRAPAMLRQGRRVDIGVETDGALELPRERAGHVRAAPAGFGRAAEATVARGCRVQLRRAE